MCPPPCHSFGAEQSRMVTLNTRHLCRSQYQVCCLVDLCPSQCLQTICRGFLGRVARVFRYSWLFFLMSWSLFCDPFSIACPLFKGSPPFFRDKHLSLLLFLPRFFPLGFPEKSSPHALSSLQFPRIFWCPFPHDFATATRERKGAGFSPRRFRFLGRCPSFSPGSLQVLCCFQCGQGSPVRVPPRNTSMVERVLINRLLRATLSGVQSFERRAISPTPPPSHIYTPKYFDAVVSDLAGAATSFLSQGYPFVFAEYPHVCARCTTGPGFV